MNVFLDFFPYFFYYHPTNIVTNKDEWFQDWNRLVPVGELM